MIVYVERALSLTKYLKFQNNLRNAKSLLSVEEFKENFPMLLVLNSIQSFTETAAITILQVILILILVQVSCHTNQSDDLFFSWLLSLLIGTPSTIR